MGVYFDRVGHSFCGWFNRNKPENAMPLEEAARLKYYGEMVDNTLDTITYKLPYFCFYQVVEATS